MDDNCPGCLGGPVAPSGLLRVSGAVVGLYTCRVCGEQWACSWDAASLPATTLHDLRTAVYAGAPGKHPHTRIT